MSAAHTPFVLVSGGKGGVGKTTLAVNLALELARSGARVLLADLDLGLANVDVLLRLTATRTLEDALAGECRIEDCVVELPGGLAVLPAGSGSARMAQLDDAARERLFAALAELAEGYDCVVGDGAAGIGPDVLGFARRADCVLLVTTPDPAALTDAYGLIKALDALSQEGAEVATPELVVNLCDGVDQADYVARKLRAVCERFLARSPRMAGWMPRSHAVRASCAAQRPFANSSPRSLEAACLRRLAARVARLFTAPAAAGAHLKG